MDCTVDSMLTTTPFFKPREGWLPMPMISRTPSALISPTMATTLLVPMSRPTNRFRSERLAMNRLRPLDVGIIGMLGRYRCRDRRVAPADGKAIGVAHVDIGNFIQAMRDDLRCGVDEALDALVDFAPSQTHRHSAVEIHLPGAARIQAQRRNAHTGIEHAALHGQIALGDLRLRAFRAAEARQFGGNVRRLPDKQFAARIQETRLAPARGGGLFDHGHVQAVRPAALNARVLHPGEGFHRALNAVEIRRHEARLAERRDGLLDLPGGDALKAAVHRNHAHRTIESPGESRQPPGDERQQRGAARMAAPLGHEGGPLPAGLLDLGFVLESIAAQSQLKVHLRSRKKLVSSPRPPSSSKSMPDWRAAIGTKL